MEYYQVTYNMYVVGGLSYNLPNPFSRKPKLNVIPNVNYKLQKYRFL